MLIAFYQVAIEQHWIENIISCHSSISLQGMTDSEILNYTMNNKIISCDVPQLVVLGISIAGWNVIYCMLILAAYLYCKKKYEISTKQSTTD